MNFSKKKNKYCKNSKFEVYYFARHGKKLTCDKVLYTSDVNKESGCNLQSMYDIVQGDIISGEVLYTSDVNKESQSKQTVERKRKEGGGRKPVTVINTFPEFYGNGMGTEGDYDPIEDWVDDVITGVVRSLTKALKKKDALNKTMLIVMLQDEDEFTTASIMETYGYGKRQAQRYLEALRVLMVLSKQTFNGYKTVDQIECIY